eukprot:TRINITY_DN4642_c0_g2_i2.p1 TRINITY_DN4642_c0_g2~~TRINITY_DN4642_c0_g2_i2.p1  ORF type:complete len:672 (-),score=125.65 TRINITY_DN4642_c0_g2_i2:882-2897(-)
MGSQLSQLISESADNDNELFVDITKISSRELTSLVDSLSKQIPNLSCLDVRRCKLKSVPINIAKLSKIQILRLEDNSIYSLPTSEFAPLLTLQELNLSKNQFTKFPIDSIRYMENLTVLKITHNTISNITPIQKTWLTSLRQLYLDSNEFSLFPIQICVLSRLTHLSLSNNKLVSLPDQISTLACLEEINLKKNVIKFVNPSICRLNNLHTLDLSENELVSLPDDMHLLSRLKHLSLQHNQFSQIPQLIFSLTALVSLKLNDNSISSLPPKIGQLTTLRELSLQENEIASLPSEIKNLRSLRKLMLEFNCLETLPTELALLNKLIVLMLHNNLLKGLPAGLKEMKTLLRLSLGNNNLSEDEIMGQKNTGTSHSRISDPTGVPASSSRRNSRHMRLGKRSTLPRNLCINPVKDLGTSGLGKMEEEKERLPGLNAKLLPTRVPTAPSLGKSSLPSLEKPSSKASDKSKKNKPEIPPFEKFKTPFTLFLDNQDLSRKRKETIKKLPPEGKWNLMIQYKEGSLELLKTLSLTQSPSKAKMKEPVPQDFVVMIRERPNKRDLSQLRQFLVVPTPFVSSFIDCGGINALATLLSSIDCKSTSRRDTNLIIEALQILEVLLEVSPKSVLICCEIVEIVGRHLVNLHFEVRKLILEFFGTVCQEHYVGHGFAQVGDGSH